ncbi:MAG: hypothetical protein ABL878_12495, partial [Burkholderiales bacterium]
DQVLSGQPFFLVVLFGAGFVRLTPSIRDLIRFVARTRRSADQVRFGAGLFIRGARDGWVGQSTNVLYWGGGYWIKRPINHLDIISFWLDISRRCRGLSLGRPTARTATLGLAGASREHGANKQHQ